MLIFFSVVIFVFSTLTLSPRPPLPRKVGVMTPQLLWERRPCLIPPLWGRGHNSGNDANSYLHFTDDYGMQRNFDFVVEHVTLGRFIFWNKVGFKAGFCFNPDCTQSLFIRCWSY